MAKENKLLICFFTLPFVQLSYSACIMPRCGESSLSLTEAEAFDSSALPGSALIDVALEPALELGLWNLNDLCVMFPPPDVLVDDDPPPPRSFLELLRRSWVPVIQLSTDTESCRSGLGAVSWAR
jgi:hypothetical protein